MQESFSRSDIWPMRQLLTSRSAFTMVELLVVVVVIGILVGLVIPIVGVAMKKAASVKTQSNIRQVGLALQLYANDHNDTYPSSWDGQATYAQKITPYLNSDQSTVPGEIFLSPSCPYQPEPGSGAIHFAINEGLGLSQASATAQAQPRRVSVKRPSETILVAESEVSSNSKSCNSGLYQPWQFTDTSGYDQDTPLERKIEDAYLVEEEGADYSGKLAFRHDGVCYMVMVDGHVEGVRKENATYALVIMHR